MKFSSRIERQEVVELLLSKMGVSTTKLGFLYLSILITLTWQDQELSQQPFQIYGNRLAEEAGLFSGHIYANMKYAIEEAWFIGNFKLMEVIFGYSLMSLVTEEPSPNKFVHAVVVALLELERNQMDIPTFINYIEHDGAMLRAFASFDPKNEDDAT